MHSSGGASASLPSIPKACLYLLDSQIHRVSAKNGLKKSCLFHSGFALLLMAYGLEPPACKCAKKHVYTHTYTSTHMHSCESNLFQKKN